MGLQKEIMQKNANCSLSSPHTGPAEASAPKVGMEAAMGPSGVSARAAFTTCEK